MWTKQPKVIEPRFLSLFCRRLVATDTDADADADTDADTDTDTDKIGKATKLKLDRFFTLLLSKTFFGDIFVVFRLFPGFHAPLKILLFVIL